MAVLTVCILTGGKGARMGNLRKSLNKSLFPINGKAAISHIIEKFPKGTEFVIGVGHLGKQVRQYLQIAHPDEKIIFVEVDNFDGPGSGPGYSLMCCKSHLQKPFLFVSCDTLWNNEVSWNPEDNWMGVAPVHPDITSKYCNLKIDKHCIIGVKDKVHVEDPNFLAFVGLCHIKDYSVFWKALGNQKIIDGEHQVSNGIRALIKETHVQSKLIDWLDIGDAEKYKVAVSQYGNYDFSKENEALYIINGKVIKFFADPLIIKRRVKKTEYNPSVFPSILIQTEQFYAYDFHPGETLYQANNQELFQRLLSWLEKCLWKPRSIGADEMKDACLKFYRDKTSERLEMFYKKYSIEDTPTHINGRNIPPIIEMLKKIPWDKLVDGIPCFIHGDLQYDNILFNSNTDSFLLLDWRQDFGGEIEFGDLYYDLAKLYGGIILNYDYIKLNLLQYSESANGISFDFAQRYKTKEYLKILSNYIRKKGYDLKKVKLLVSLIFLNMSPLHHYPFDKLLYSLGRELLNDQLYEVDSPGSAYDQ